MTQRQENKTYLFHSKILAMGQIQTLKYKIHQSVKFVKQVNLETHFLVGTKFWIDLRLRGASSKVENSLKKKKIMPFLPNRK